MTTRTPLVTSIRTLALSAFSAICATRNTGSLATGCVSNQQAAGNIGALLRLELLKRGARARTDVTCQTICGEWIFWPDQHGFVMLVKGEPFEAIDAWLKQAFGEPTMSEERNVEGQPFRLYSKDQIGVLLQCVGHRDGVQLLCLGRVQAS